MARGGSDDEDEEVELEDEDFEAGASDGGSGSEPEPEQAKPKPKRGAKRPKASSSKKPKKRPKRGDKGAKEAPAKRKGSEYFEEEADEEDEGSEEGGRKRAKASRFIDDIAAVDSDEEEEEADEDVDDMLAHNDEDLGGEDLGTGNVAARYRQLDALRLGGEQGQTEEELARYLEDKYKDADVDDDGDLDGAYEEEDVGQQGLQPTKEDPGLFIVTCRIGAEREACLQLLQKAYTLAERGTPLSIKSAACLDHLKGFIYVEAFRDSHVLEAIRGLRTLYTGKGARLVPLKERPAAITVNRQAKAAIERDAWVRVRNGLYKDDLAKVLDVDYAGGRATIRLVPRLDLQQMAKDHMGGGGKRNPFGRQAVRPPPRPFKAKEAGELGLPVGKDRNDPAIITLNTHRFLDGYTLRNYNLKGLILQDVAPPLEEISRFNQAGMQGDVEDPNDPASSLRQLLKALPEGAAAKATYVKGDRVLVIAGDLVSIEGTVEDVRAEEGKLHVRPDLMAEQVVELELAEVQKLFKAGDHVRVLSGQHAGQKGMVVKVDGPLCIILPDAGTGELKAFARDLTEAVDTGTGVETLGGKYELHDLVQLDANTAGVIISIDKDVARVLTNQSTLKQQDVRACREVDIQRKLQINRASSQDVSGATINVGDYVMVMDASTAAAAAAGSRQAAARKERGGTVHAISRGVLFVRSTDGADRGGFMVVRSKQVRLRGSNGCAAAAAANAAAGVGGAGPPGMGVLASPGHAPGAGAVDPWADRGGAGAGFSGRGGASGGGFGGGRGRGRGSELQGVEVTVRSGPYARYKGRVKQETPTHLQLELDAINRIVTVKKEDVFGRGGQFAAAGAGSFTPGRGFIPAAGGFRPQGFTPGVQRTPAHAMPTPLHPSMGGATPIHPSRTPLHPSQTPLHPGMTPMHPSQTPMHPSQTPMHPSQTPMHPGMTPAHPSMEADYFQGPSGRTPAAATPGAYGMASTPGTMGGFAPAPTPGTAETPGGTFAGPGAAAATPGGLDAYAYAPPAATPGGAYAHAPTPGGAYAHAPTPGGHDLVAPSPGGGLLAGEGGQQSYYYAQPTPGLGATPGTVATPGMITGYTPAGLTPGVAYTPGGLDAPAATPGLDPSLAGPPGGQLGHPGMLQAPAAPRGPDYRDVLVKLPDGRTGVAVAVHADGSIEAAPLEGGDPIPLNVVELVDIDKKDRVKVVAGDRLGTVGEVMLFDGGDAVLQLGGAAHEVIAVDRTFLGKLRDQAAAPA